MTRPKGTASRSRILDAAVRLFCERGFRETRIGDIEAAAGLTRRAGGFYRHFPSKEAVLIAAVRRMAEDLIGELTLDEVLALPSIRAELLLIARSLLRHAAAHRPLRLLLQREGHRVPALRREIRSANAKLATLDVVPWVASALARSGLPGEPRQVGLLVFGPVLTYLISLDRGQPAFGLKDEAAFLAYWADHWTEWFDGAGAR